MKNRGFPIIYRDMFFIGLKVADSITSSIVPNFAFCLIISNRSMGETYGYWLFKSFNGNILQGLSIRPGNRSRPGSRQVHQNRPVLFGCLY